MATNLITGETIPDYNSEKPQDLFDYQKKYTDGASDNDPVEKRDAVRASALNNKNMPGDQAWKFEQTRASTAWDPGMDLLRDMAFGTLPLATGRHITKAVVGEPGVDVLKRSVKTVPDEVKHAVMTASGLESPGVINRELRMGSLGEDIFKEYGNRNFIPGVPFKLTDVAALPQNIAFSVTSMAAGLASAAPFSAVPIPGARAVPMLLGSGMAAYNMAKYEFIQGMLEEKHEEEPLTAETEQQWRRHYEAAGHRYGLWEAIPEALSNLAFVGILAGKLTNIVAKPVAKRLTARLTAKFGKKAAAVAGKAASGMFNIGAMFGQELVTEATTQYGQARIEEEVGMRKPGEGQISMWQALKEVAAPTIALTMILGGSGAGMVWIVKKGNEQFKKDTKGKDPKKVKQAKVEKEDMYDKVSKELIEKERQKKLMTEDSLKGLIGWVDEEGNYHSALEEKPEEKTPKKPEEKTPEKTPKKPEEKIPEKPKKKRNKYPDVINTAIAGIKKFQERLTNPDIKKRKDVEEERKAVADLLNRSKLLPLYPRRRMVEAINKMKGISTELGRKRFSALLDEVIEQIELVQKKKDLIENIKQRQLQRVDNLRKAAKLPAIKNMTSAQIAEFTEMLAPYKQGDIFLTQRQIETVDNTDLSGIRTRREAQERLAKEAGVPVSELQTIKVSWADKFRQDERLRHRNPIFKLLVEGFHAVMIKADLSHRAFEKKNNDLAIKARKSRKRGLIQRLVPTDELVFNYLSSENKTEIEAEMTKEELEWALFLQEQYAKALEYLVQKQRLKTGLQNYITNLRRGFLEGLTKGGIGSAFKEMFDAHKQDEQGFNILDGDTGMILPLEKFFQFSMKRTGNINPTKNVAKASEVYFQTFYKMIALDAIMPKMMIYVSSITPLKETPRGLEFDRSIEKFVKAWINAKKGRKAQHFIPQGGKLDIGILTLKSLIMIWDLGLNIPIQIAATGGELTAGYATLGKKRYAEGVARFATPKGRKFVEKFEGFVGKTLWQELLEPSKHIGDKFGTLLMGGFASSSTRMNKISLLGLITKEEYDSGNVSPKRLAEIKLEIGKMRVIAGGKSIWESTTGGGLWTQYKTWALPILATNVSDSITNTKRLANWSRNILKDFAKFDVKSFGDRLKEMSEVQKTEEMTRLRREVEVLVAAAFVFSIITVDEDDKSFTGQLLFKVRREIFTILGALDIKMWLAAPRLVAWLAQMAEGVSMLLAGEKYKSEGRENELKGLTRLQQMATPRMLSMNKGDKKTEVGGIF